MKGSRVFPSKCISGSEDGAAALTVVDYLFQSKLHCLVFICEY